MLLDCKLREKNDAPSVVAQNSKSMALRSPTCQFYTLKETMEKFQIKKLLGFHKTSSFINRWEKVGWIDITQNEKFHNLEIYSSTGLVQGTTVHFSIWLKHGMRNYSSTRLGQGMRKFSSTRFGQGMTNFSSTRLGQDMINNSSTMLDQGMTNFSSTRLGQGMINNSSTRLDQSMRNFFIFNFIALTSNHKSHEILQKASNKAKALFEKKWDLGWQTASNYTPRRTP